MKIELTGKHKKSGYIIGDEPLTRKSLTTILTKMRKQSVCFWEYFKKDRIASNARNLTENLKKNI